MKNLYIGGGQKTKKSSGLKWKLLLSLCLFLAVSIPSLKMAAPLLLERWINQQGATAAGHSWSIRDVNLSIEKREMTLTDVKVFNPETEVELMEIPSLTIMLNWQDMVLSEKKKLLMVADKVNLFLSKDFSAEIGQNQKYDFYLASVNAKVNQLNIIEQQQDMSRTVLELNDVDLKLKEISLSALNQKTEFSINSKIATGGKLVLAGKTYQAVESKAWEIEGSLKDVPADIFNKIAGDKLPFAFNETKLNAQIVAQSDKGLVRGEIAPDIQKLNLIQEKPGLPTQTIARLLTDDLTFTLPFTLKDKLTLEYEETYKKLKTYRKYPATAQVNREFWPF